MRRLNNEIFFKENFIFAHTCDFLKTLGSGETVPTEVFHEALKKYMQKPILGWQEPPNFGQVLMRQR